MCSSDLFPSHVTTGSVAILSSLTNIDPSNVVVVSRDSFGSSGSVGRVVNPRPLSAKG